MATVSTSGLLICGSGLTVSGTTSLAAVSTSGLLTCGSGLTVSGTTSLASGLNATTAIFSSTVSAISYNATSDYRIKSNIKTLDNSINLDNLRPVTYFNTKLNKQDIGIIAHELREYYPFLVTGQKNDEELQTVNYTGLIGILIHETNN